LQGGAPELRLDTTPARPSVKFVLYSLQWCLHSALVLGVYLCLLLLGVLGQVSLITLISLGFLAVFVLLGFAVKSNAVHSTLLKVVWPLLVLWAFVVLGLCYVVQFPAMYDALQAALAGRRIMSLSDLGLRLESILGDRVLYLLGPAMLFALSVLQVAISHFSSLLVSPLTHSLTRSLHIRSS
jgi:hypothetical protein